MTGNEDPERSNDSRPQPDDDNPFVAFRRFADEQISSMLQSVMGLPSIVSTPPPDHWAIFDEQNNKRVDQSRQAQNDDAKAGESPTSSGQDESGNTDNRVPSRSRWPDSDENSRVKRSGRHGTSSPDLLDIDFFDSFFDKFWFDDHVSNRFFHPYHRPMFSSMVNEDSPAWPVYYLMFSPYSPLHLERQAHYRSHRDKGVFSSIMSSLRPSSDEHDPAEPQWREAFEDLLRLENGRPMLDREATDVSKQESGRDWLQGLAKRGSLGDHWKYVSGPEGKTRTGITYDSFASRADGNKGEDGNTQAEISWSMDDDTEATELDFYGRFLTDIEAREREFFGGAYESPLLRLIFDDRRRLRDEHVPSQRSIHDDDSKDWLSPVNTDQQTPVSDSKPEEYTSVPAIASPPDSNFEQKTYVTSTSTSTERVRLSDGSVRTKIIKTQRFSDGREERNETVEVVNPTQSNTDPGRKEETGSDSNNGWFWKDK
ncbi:hypothetical protein FE257_010287 [Aspergillus nanangensis]|uniref:Uncharacterized protein n=1 Tax=Aspergillus nanangensis TaxID=2582783 RepID=A0AAD4GS56_ASPNN|nr:hypothetical protein FE257_010287 [Aspergillus nanangensis]